MTPPRTATPSPVIGAPAAELARSLRAFHEISGCHAAVWTAVVPNDGGPPTGHPVWG